MSKIDIDNSGTIDYKEFVMAAINRQKLLNQENRATFKIFDKDGSDTISCEELKSLLNLKSDIKKIVRSTITGMVRFLFQNSKI